MFLRTRGMRYDTQTKILKSAESFFMPPQSTGITYSLKFDFIITLLLLYRFKAPPF
jgi:hypothetical protein